MLRDTHIQFLKNAVVVIASLALKRFEMHPLRRNIDLQRGFDDPLNDEADFVDYNNKCSTINTSLPLGDPRLDIQIDSSVHGGGKEPDGSEVHSGFKYDDFDEGETVLAWWWGKWWIAKVQYKAKSTQTLTIRWEWDHSVSPLYKPHLVSKFTNKHLNTIFPSLKFFPDKRNTMTNCNTYSLL